MLDISQFKDEFDLFICHADMDKQDIVLPIVAACKQLGIRVWLDSSQISWGDDLVSKVALGLKKSKLVLVVASEQSVNRGWPLKEISLAMADEIATQSVRVLPLFVGDRASLIQKVPILANKKSLDWESNPQEIANQIANKLGRDISSTKASPPLVSSEAFMPKLKGEFTDRDRDKFVHTSFAEICDYFDVAGKRFESTESRIEFESQKPDSDKYRCTIYLDGNRKCQCQIWIDSSFGKAGINFFNGQAFSGEFNSTNEMIRIDDSTDVLRLSGTMGKFAGHNITNASAKETADVLWNWFVSRVP